MKFLKKVNPCLFQTIHTVGVIIQEKSLSLDSEHEQINDYKNNSQLSPLDKIVKFPLIERFSYDLEKWFP